MDIDDMPNEILSNIFQFLTPESLMELEKVRFDYEEIIGQVFHEISVAVFVRETGGLLFNTNIF